MDKVIEEAVKSLERGESCVLATLIQTRGSTPQKPGAKLLVQSDGTIVGTIGGGCVEAEIWATGKKLLESGGTPQYCEYELTEELAVQDGLVCGGVMSFFLDPIRKATDFLPYAREILSAYRGGNPVTLATVVKTPASSHLGAKYLIRQDNTIAGFLGNTALEDMAREAACRVIDYAKSEYLVTEDGTEVFIEGFTTIPTLVVMGGGHIAKALASVAKIVGFRICIIDNRPQFATKERFPEAETVVFADFSSGLTKLSVNTNTFIVVATAGHKFDFIALEAAVKSPAGYVGMVGSQRKTALIFKELLKQGIPEERIKAVHAPIGLSIGAVTPEEIAISIIGEMIMFRHGGSGRPLKLKES